MKLKYVVLAVLAAVPFIACGEEAQPVVSGWYAFQAKAQAFFASIPESWEAMGAVGGFVLLGIEALFRLIKSDKPRSILYAVAKILDKVPAFLEEVAALVQAAAHGARKLAVLLNRLIPQRLKEAPPKVEPPK